MTTAHNGSAPRFQRTRSGYDPVAVNHYIAELVLRQQAQHCEIETLKAEIASLKDENAALKDTSPSAQAVTDRMAKCFDSLSTRSSRCSRRHGPRPQH